MGLRREAYGKWEMPALDSFFLAAKRRIMLVEWRGSQALGRFVVDLKIPLSRGYVIK